MTDEELIKRLRSQVGDDVQHIYDHEVLFKFAADRIEELESKLAKAVEVAEKSIKWLRLYGADVHREAVALKKLTGGKDD